MKNKKGEIMIYKNKSTSVVDVRLENNTIWLSQRQMSLLFSKDIRTINDHINNVFKEKELKKNPSVIRKFRITAEDGKQYNTFLYNLDMIISIGYRVNSKKATQFRIWATNILKKYILDGYAINEKRILEAKEKLVFMNNLRIKLEYKRKSTA